VQIFLQKHASAKGERLVSGNSMFFRMHRILDIYFVGGFGTVQFIDVDEYKGTRPDAIVMDHPHQTLQARGCGGADSASPHLSSLIMLQRKLKPRASALYSTFEHHLRTTCG